MGLSLLKTSTIALLVSLLFLRIDVFGQEESTTQSHKFTNNLINETSSYLLEHAHNPVNWNPWSDTLLQKAKEQDKLIVISVGYSSCHWCHVMARETFEDEEVASLMNLNFINIKVDREERPDIDQLYMTAVQLIKGQGGWPLNVILLPNGKPLYGGTYHTKEQWINTLEKINALYRNNPEKLVEFGEKITQGIAELNLVDLKEEKTIASLEQLNVAIYNWQKEWDYEWGGDKGSQKFMLPENLSFLLDYGILSKNEKVLEHVETTLDKILLGGIYDHVEGGFFRYSTDPYWKVPHFEKMLYDNAQLVTIYSRAYRVFKKEIYKNAAMSTIAFLETNMRNSSGVFFATIDADSDGKEGAYYLWKKEKLKDVITSDFDLFSAYFNITNEAILEEENYTLFKSMSDEDFIKEHNLDASTFIKIKEKWLQKLVAARKLRVAPKIDKKIITSWNALMINGYVEAYRTFGNLEYLESANKIMNFIKENLYKDNRLSHSIVNKIRNENGFVEDYAFLINGSINLYTVSLNQDDLNFAKSLTEDTNKLFLDPNSSMYNYSSNEKLITKIIKTDDGVLPSPNSIMAQNLLELGHLLYNVDYIEQTDKMLNNMQTQLLSSPNNYSVWGSVLLEKLYPFYEVAIVGDKAENFIRKLNTEYIPNTIIIGSLKNSELPLFEDRFVEGETYIYVCQNSTCKLPVTTPNEAINQLK